MHFALQSQEQGVPKVPLPKIGPIRRILAKNPIFCLGNDIELPQQHSQPTNNPSNQPR